MELALTIGYIVIALALTVVVLTQQGKNTYASSAIMGSGDTFFSKNKANTLQGKLERATAIVAVLFIVMSVVLTLFSKVGL
ncbi:MAG: preprotein translocase subunit SecG [Clostridia bacterium]|nr:preprotein translocase subunit SecG [Clostridia bacterium]